LLARLIVKKPQNAISRLFLGAAPWVYEGAGGEVEHPILK